MKGKAAKQRDKRDVRKPIAPITHWSHSSLMAYLRNPLAWYKRYVEKIYDIPSSSAAIVGRAAHVALQHYYGGIAKEGAIDLGLEYLRNVPDFEINFGVAKTRVARKKKREAMEREYLQAIGFYLEKPPKHDVVGIEVSGKVEVPGFLLPLKAISDLVVRSKIESNALDIVDHKFVDSFTPYGKDKAIFVIQAMFNYYTVRAIYKQPVRRFIFIECKKRKNADGTPQLRRSIIDFTEQSDLFRVFRRLINDATISLLSTKVFLPNPSDMFEGEDSFTLYRLGLIDDRRSRRG